MPSETSIGSALVGNGPGRNSAWYVSGLLVCGSLKAWLKAFPMCSFCISRTVHLALRQPHPRPLRPHHLCPSRLHPLPVLHPSPPRRRHTRAPCTPASLRWANLVNCAKNSNSLRPSFTMPSAFQNVNRIYELQKPCGEMIVGYGEFHLLLHACQGLFELKQGRPPVHFTVGVFRGADLVNGLYFYSA
jgi:hypothetical protein